MKLRVNLSSLSALRDSYLITRSKNGDREAFGKLYLNYLDQIYRYVYFRVSQRREIAEDITEEVFMKAFENIKGFETKNGNFKAWLYKIARNRTSDYLRKKIKYIPLKEYITDDSTNLEDSLVKKDGIRTVMKAINALPKLQKEVVTLTYINDLSNEDTAKLINRENTAVRALKYRAIKKLKEILNHE